MKINDIFRKPIDRRIEEVIKVDLADEEAVARELEEYVVTDHIRGSLERLLDHYQETIRKPNEATNVWVSGFFGAGKSSFAKVLGYLLENPSIQGLPAAERFLGRSGTDREHALLKTIHSQVGTVAVFVDLSSSKNVAREGESVVLPLYRAVLERLGYSRDFALAELEYTLEGDGDLGAFEEAFARVSGARGDWKARRNVGLARNEASHALHLLRPQTYPSPDSYARSLRPLEISANFFADRLLELLSRRQPHAQRVVFVVDEMGQYVARSVDRMFDLMGLAHAVQKKRGLLWLVVTSQEKLEDVVDNLEGRKVELARVTERFPRDLWVDLIPEDIEEVASKRVLVKNDAGRKAVLDALQQHRNKLEASIRLDSPTRSREFSAEQFARLYPLLPYQIQLFVDAVSAHRARGGAGPMLGGSNRTLIKLAQQLIVSQKTDLAQKEVGGLVTVDMAYDLLESLIPTSWQAEIRQVAERHGERGLPTRVTKAVALLTGVAALKLTPANLAALLHPAIDAESLRDQAATALQTLTQEEVLRVTDEGYKLQSPEEKCWERERRGIEMRDAAFERLKRQAIQDLLGGLSVQATPARAFRVQIAVEDHKVVDGEVPLVILEREPAEREAVRSRSRESTAERTVFWVYRCADDTHDAALELHRSKVMLDRKQGVAREGPELPLLGEERKRQERHERLLDQKLARDLLAGEVFFQGVGEQLPGADLRTTAAEVLKGKVSAIYPELERFAAPVRRADALAVLQADNLDGLPDYLGEEGLGVVRRCPDGVVLAVDREPLASVLREIKDRANKYGREASGKHLEEEFAGPPYGATVEAVQVLAAAGVRAGEVEVLYQGGRITSPGDARLQKVFGTLPGFRSATFLPQRELDADTRARVARRLGEQTGDRPPLAADQLAGRLRGHFKPVAEAAGRVEATFRGLGVAAPEGVHRAREIAAGLAEADDAEVIKTCDDTWADLVEGQEQARRLDRQVDEHALQALRAARDEVERRPAGLGEEAQAAHARLADLLRAPDLADRLAEIRTLVQSLKQQRQAVWLEAAGRLRERVGHAAGRVRARDWARLEASTVEEALRPLLGLEPPEGATAETGPAVEVLQARLPAVVTLAEEIERELEALASKVEIVRVRARDLYDGVVTSEEDLAALLERIRNAAQEALSRGKHFTLS
jgi:hypothetical protein